MCAVFTFIRISPASDSKISKAAVNISNVFDLTVMLRDVGPKRKTSGKQSNFNETY